MKLLNSPKVLSSCRQRYEDFCKDAMDLGKLLWEKVLSQLNFLFELSKHSSQKSKKYSWLVFVRSNRNIFLHFLEMNIKIFLKLKMNTSGTANSCDPERPNFENLKYEIA